MGYIGIDFGMHNIKVCYLNDGNNRPLKVDLEGNQNGHVSKQSVNAVFYYEDDETFELEKAFFSSPKAEAAKEYGDPDYVSNIKTKLMEERYSRSFCNGKYTFSCLDIITDIFKRIYEKMTESGYNMSSPTVLTAPIIFTELHKKKLRYCAEKAGFNVKEVISEPFAALFSDRVAAELFSDEKAKYVMIFDFGASTLDICVARIGSKNSLTYYVTALTSAGLEYGGENITKDIAEYLMKRKSMQELYAKSLKEGRCTEESWVIKLNELAEKLKIGVYREYDEEEITERLFGLKITLTRNEVESLLENKGVWRAVENCISEMFNNYEYEEIEPTDVAKIVMTGGTSKITFFRDRLEKMFSKSDMIGDSEDDDDGSLIYNAVSVGAALYGSYSETKSLEIQNTLPLTIGIDRGKGFETAIRHSNAYKRKGRRIDLSRQWLEDNNWHINVYQNKRKDTPSRPLRIANSKDILPVGWLQLNSILYDGDTVSIYLQMTENGIQAVTEIEPNKAIETLDIISEVTNG